MDEILDYLGITPLVKIALALVVGSYLGISFLRKEYRGASGDPGLQKYIIFQGFAAVAMVVVFLYVTYKIESIKTEEAASRTQAVERIERTKESIESILRFLDDQKVNMLRLEETVSALDEERRRLEPILSMNREQVDALIAVYRDRTTVERWFDRGSGFLTGILSSLIAAMIGRRYSLS